MGLRERKKLATRQALSWSAIRLAVERGLENVHVEDIAAGAGVSPRTYNNYFANKYEAICAVTVDRAELIAEALLARPAREPLADALLAAMMAYYQPPGELDRDWVSAVRLMMTSPALRGEMLKANELTEELLAAAIATRCGADVDADMQPRIVAAVTFGAARVGIRHWLLSGTDRSFVTVLAEALRLGLSGFDGSRG